MRRAYLHDEVTRLNVLASGETPARALGLDDLHLAPRPLLKSLVAANAHRGELARSSSALDGQERVYAILSAQL